MKTKSFIENIEEVMIETAIKDNIIVNFYLNNSKTVSGIIAIYSNDTYVVIDSEEIRHIIYKNNICEMVFTNKTNF